VVSLFLTGGGLLCATVLLSFWARWLAGRPQVSTRWEAAPRLVLPAVLAPLLGAALLLARADGAIAAGGPGTASALSAPRWLTVVAAALVVSFLLALAARTLASLRPGATAAPPVRRHRARSGSGCPPAPRGGERAPHCPR
jgi:hypothetical protein